MTFVKDESSEEFGPDYTCRLCDKYGWHDSAPLWAKVVEWLHRAFKMPWKRTGHIQVPDVDKWVLDFVAQMKEAGWTETVSGVLTSPDGKSMVTIR